MKTKPLIPVRPDTSRDARQLVEDLLEATCSAPEETPCVSMDGARLKYAHAARASVTL